MTYAMDYVARPFDSMVRKDSKRFCQKVWCMEIFCFIKNTPEIQDKIDKCCDRRVEMTWNTSTSRSIDDAGLSYLVLYGSFGKELVRKH